MTAVAFKPWTDADQVREHITTLIAAGASRESVARAAGVSPATVQAWFHRTDGLHTTRVSTMLATRILAVVPGTATRGRVPNPGTVRRIQGMCTLGWPLRQQAARIGWGLPNYHALLDQAWTSQPTARLVRRLYDRLSMTPAPASRGATRARNDARRKGWFPPLAWDDDTIDDPVAVPCLLPPVEGSDPAADEWAIQHLMADHVCVLDRPTRVEVVRRLLAAGWSYERVAARIGRSVSFTRDAVAEIVRAAGAASVLGEMS